MSLLCLLNRSQYGPAAETWRWNAGAWPGNRVCLLNANNPTHHRLFKSCKLTHRIYVTSIKEAAHRLNEYKIIMLNTLLLCINLFFSNNLSSCCFFWTELTNFALCPQGPPTDAPAVDTAEQVYISSLALLKVITGLWLKSIFTFY